MYQQRIVNMAKLEKPMKKKAAGIESVKPGLKLKQVTMGWEKVGKTEYAASLFNSQYIDPERILYLDNHGSTVAFNLPEWSTSNPFGVREIPEDQPELVLEIAKDIRRDVARGIYKYDAFIIDDISEHGLVSVAELNDESENDKLRMKNWGIHLERMTATIRLLNPKRTGAHLIIVARASWSGDPKEKRDRSKITDERAQVVRPFLQGKFGDWMPFQMDLVTYQDTEVHNNGDIDFRMLLYPEGDIQVANRWLKHWINDAKEHKLAKDRKLPRVLMDPTFDKLYEIIKEF